LCLASLIWVSPIQSPEDRIGLWFGPRVIITEKESMDRIAMERIDRLMAGDYQEPGVQSHLPRLYGMDWPGES
jgi:hypothetical protein